MSRKRGTAGPPCMTWELFWCAKTRGWGCAGQTPPPPSPLKTPPPLPPPPPRSKEALVGGHGANSAQFFLCMLPFHQTIHALSARVASCYHIHTSIPPNPQTHIPPPPRGSACGSSGSRAGPPTLGPPPPHPTASPPPPPNCPAPAPPPQVLTDSWGVGRIRTRCSCPPPPPPGTEVGHLNHKGWDGC